MRHARTAIVVLGLLLPVNLSAATAPIDQALATARKLVAAEMEVAGEQHGVALDTSTMLVLSRDDLAIVAATNAEMPFIPSTALAKGVDVAGIHIAGEADSGFRVLRARANPGCTPGTFDAELSLVDAKGNETAIEANQALVIVDSVEVPPEAEPRVEFSGGVTGDAANRLVTVYAVCSNGWAVCFEVDWFTLLSYL